MVKINEKDLNFLDFILPLFSEDINASYDLKFYANDYKIKTGIEFTIDDLRMFIAEYDNKYVIKFGSGITVKISIEMKRIIDQYGSLSKYLSEYNKSNKRHNRFEKAKSNAPIIISSISVIVVITFGILNFRLNNKVDSLQNDIIKKDSIILEFNNQIKNIDTIKIKAHKPNGS